MSSKPVKIINEWKSVSPLEINFEAERDKRVKARPSYFTGMSSFADNDAHHIINISEIHSGETTSTLTFEPQPTHVDPETIVMSWVLHYGDGSTAHMMRLQKLLSEPSRLAAVGIDSMRFWEAGRLGYKTAYTLHSPIGRNLLTVINYRDRLVSVSNTGFITDNNPDFNGGKIIAAASPTPLAKVELPEQLERFGSAVETVGRFAIPGIVPLNKELGLA